MMKLKENLKDPSLVSRFADYNASQYMYPFIIEKQLHPKLYQTATVLSFFHSWWLHISFEFLFSPEILPPIHWSGYE